MAGLKDGRWRVRLGLGAVVVLILAVVGVALAKSNAPANDASQKTIGRAIDVSLVPRKYQFIGQGQLQGGSGNTLLIGNVPVVVDSQTQFAGSIQPGESVSLSGYILANHSWLADRIEPVLATDTFFIFAGPLDSSSNSVWDVGGISVLVDKNTVIDPGLNPQDMVLVTFSVQVNGNWLASKIESLQNGQDILPPTPTAAVKATVVPVNPVPKVQKTPEPQVVPDKPKPKGGGDKGGKKGGKNSQGSDSVMVCHKGHTQAVSRNGLAGHLKHGDGLGPCR
jgi:hypothetical protein